MLGEQIITVIFEGGNFTSASTDLVTAALTWFAIGLVGYGLTEIITRVFYATRDTRTPVITGILTIILNIILAALLIDSLGIEGLAIALSATTAAEAVIMLLFLRYRSGQVFSSGFFGWLARVILATAMMGVVIGFTDDWLDMVLQADVSVLVQVAYFGLSMAVYVTTFVLTAWFLRIPELQQSVAKFARRIPSSLRNRLIR
jgi:putative peptidoglycan lipid II flippase